MAIFSGTRNILTVIYMEDSNLIFPKLTVKSIDDIIEVVNDIIAAVAGMTGIKADS